jgi:hypothetical protein
MALTILLPYATLLECRLDTTVIISDNKDIRRIGDITKLFWDHGWDFLKAHLPAEKDNSWWETVQTIAENFNWDLYRTPSMPAVRPFEGTLEFYQGGGNHRAMALALRRGHEEIPVTLNL